MNQKVVVVTVALESRVTYIVTSHGSRSQENIFKYLFKAFVYSILANEVIFLLIDWYVRWMDRLDC